MTRHLNRLTVRAIERLKTPGRHADGGNLYVKATRLGSGDLSVSYTFWYRFGERQREAGLGSRGVTTLTQARDKAAEFRSLLAKGIDPLAERTAAKEARAKRKTFGECADAFLKSKRGGWRSEKYTVQWASAITNYCGPILDKPVDAINTPDVLRVLKPIWARVPVRASRLCQQIEAVLDYGKAHGWRAGENPAAWRGHLALILPKRSKQTHHAAMPYAEIPAFVGKLREVKRSIGVPALEFLILTAGRLNEVLGATWDEIDLEAKVWTIPAERMKAGREHCVPLSARAMMILNMLAEFRVGDFVFPGQGHGKPMTHTVFTPLLPDVTAHGFRSSFRDWAGEETSFPREIAEHALAHLVGNSTERAYRRGDALEKRRALMEAWANYCEPVGVGNVVPLRA